MALRGFTFGLISGGGLYYGFHERVWAHVDAELKSLDRMTSSLGTSGGPIFVQRQAEPVWFQIEKEFDALKLCWNAKLQQGLIYVTSEKTHEEIKSAVKESAVSLFNQAKEAIASASKPTAAVVASEAPISTQAAAVDIAGENVVIPEKVVVAEKADE
eukprot:Colp12_sorted_trinity150504_noHs@10754